MNVRSQRNDLDRYMLHFPKQVKENYTCVAAMWLTIQTEITYPLLSLVSLKVIVQLR